MFTRCAKEKELALVARTRCDVFFIFRLDIAATPRTSAQQAPRDCGYCEIALGITFVLLLTKGRTFFIGGGKSYGGIPLACFVVTQHTPERPQPAQLLHLQRLRNLADHACHLWKWQRIKQVLGQHQQRAVRHCSGALKGRPLQVLAPCQPLDAERSSGCCANKPARAASQETGEGDGRVGAV
eukprot:1195010-Prorocentrum_minimum.AAC.12